jgi:chromate transport protein ChrA
MQKLLARYSKLANNSLKYGVAAILLAVPLYPKFPFLTIPGIQVAVRLEDFVMLSVFFIWLVAVLPNIKSFLRDRITLSILLFFAVGMISLLFAVVVGKTASPHIGFLHWARRVEYLSAFFIGMYSVKKKEDLYFYIKILLIVVVVAFFYGIGQKYYNIPVITTQNADYSRGIALRYRPGAHLVSTFAGHYDLASFIILVMPTLYLFLFSKSETLKKFVKDTKPIITRVIILVVVLMGVWLLTQTASRISLVSYLGSSIFALILMNKKKFIPIVLIISFVLASFSMNLIDRYLNIVDVYAQTELPEELPSPDPVEVVEDRSTSIRLNVEWPRAVRALTKNPLTGTGYSSISLATDNDYLRMLGEVGILGFASFFTFMGAIIYALLNRFPKSISVLPEDYFKVGVFTALAGVALNMVFIDILEASKFAIMFWLLLGLAVGVTRNEKDK